MDVPLPDDELRLALRALIGRERRRCVIRAAARRRCRAHPSGGPH